MGEKRKEYSFSEIKKILTESELLTEIMEEVVRANFAPF